MKKAKTGELRAPMCKICGGPKEDLRGTGDFMCCTEYVGNGIKEFNDTVSHIVKGKFGFDVGR